MYRLFLFSLQIASKSKLLIFVLIIELIFSMFLTLDCAFQIFDITYPQRIMNSKSKDNFLYFSPIDYRAYALANNTEIASTESPYKDFDKLQGELSVDNTYTFVDVDKRIELHSFPEEITKFLNVSMRKGVWLSKSTNQNDGTIPCVVSDYKKKIGEIIEFKNEDDTVWKLKVIGIAEAPYIDIDQYIGGENLGLSSVIVPIQKTELLAENKQLIWISNTYINDYLKTVEIISPNRLIMYKNVTPEQRSANEIILKNTGSVFTVNNSADSQTKEQILKSNIPITFCVWIIFLIGFSCSVKITLNRSLIYLNIYKSCGADYMQNFITAFISILCIPILSSLIVSVLLPIFGVFNIFNQTLSFVKIGYLILFCIFIILSLIILFLVKTTIRKKEYYIS